MHVQEVRDTRTHCHWHIPFSSCVGGLWFLCYLSGCKFHVLAAVVAIAHALLPQLPPLVNSLASMTHASCLPYFSPLPDVLFANCSFVPARPMCCGHCLPFSSCLPFCDGVPFTRPDPPQAMNCGWRSLSKQAHTAPQRFPHAHTTCRCFWMCLAILTP
jgi:hypothetical protein